MKKKQHVTRPTGTRLYDDEIAALDTYRRAQTNPESRSAAIRNLLRKSLSQYFPKAEERKSCCP